MPNPRTRSFLHKIFIFPAHKSCRNPLGRLRPWRCAAQALPAGPHSGLQALAGPEDRGWAGRRPRAIWSRRTSRWGLGGAFRGKRVSGSGRVRAPAAAPPHPSAGLPFPLVWSPRGRSRSLQSPHPRSGVAPQRVGPVRAREFHSHGRGQWPRGAPSWARWRGTGPRGGRPPEPARSRGSPAPHVAGTVTPSRARAAVRLPFGPSAWAPRGGRECPRGKNGWEAAGSREPLFQRKEREGGRGGRLQAAQARSAARGAYPGPFLRGSARRAVTAHGSGPEGPRQPAPHALPGAPGMPGPWPCGGMGPAAWLAGRASGEAPDSRLWVREAKFCPCACPGAPPAAPGAVV